MQSAWVTLPARPLFITGASRGIGLAIALRAARDGANVVIAAKSGVANPKLPGTIHTAAAAVEAAGGKALPLQVDIREEAAVVAAAAQAAEHFGGIDIVVNNASAIWLAGVEGTPMKRFDLMQQVNTRGTFVTTQACLPYLKRAANPHVLMLSPPPSLDPKWFAPHTAYTIAKMGMSLCVLGMSEEFRPLGIAVNALWPRTVIATAAIAMIDGVQARALPHARDRRRCRARDADASGDASTAAISPSTKRCWPRPVSPISRLMRFRPGAELLPDLFLD